METGLYLRDASEAQWPLIRHVLAVPSALQEAVFVERTRGYAKLPVPIEDAGAPRDCQAAIPAFELVDISTREEESRCGKEWVGASELRRTPNSITKDPSKNTVTTNTIH